MAWRYEFIVIWRPYTEFMVLDGGEFPARDADDARTVLASVVRNIKISGPTKPDVIRLIDPTGREV